jgi:hypothetical protein
MDFVKRKRKLVVVLWAGIVGFLVIDPLAATGIGAKGIELWNRWTKKA